MDIVKKNEEFLLNIEKLKTYFFTDEGIVKAVDEVDLGIEQGEVLGLVGESGCGKSTVALSIMRLIQNPGKIVSGKINFQGTDLLELNETQMREIRGGEISMIFQDPMSSLNPVYSVGNQVGEAVILHQKLRRKDEIRLKIEDIFRKVGIGDANLRIDDYPHEFSGGMRQRIMIAMALSCNPKLLIADEPTTSLDVTIQAQILELMKDLKEQFRTSILLITHDLGVIAELSDKVAVMYAGKLVEFGSSYIIFKNPEHPYTQALLRSIPRLDVVQEKLGTIPGRVPSLIDTGPGCRFYNRCSFALDICNKEEPPIIDVGDEIEHRVNCFLVAS